jgi:hypothetical protein
VRSSFRLGDPLRRWHTLIAGAVDGQHISRGGTQSHGGRGRVKRCPIVFGLLRIPLPLSGRLRSTPLALICMAQSRLERARPVPGSPATDGLTSRLAGRGVAAPVTDWSAEPKNKRRNSSVRRPAGASSRSRGSRSHALVYTKVRDKHSATRRDAAPRRPPALAVRKDQSPTGCQPWRTGSASLPAILLHTSTGGPSFDYRDTFALR